MHRRATYLFAAAAVLLAAGASWLWVGAQPRAHNPLAQLVRDAIDDQPIEGLVEQRLAVGSYTYLALRTRSEQPLWAVTMGSGAPPGARVKVRIMGHSEQFYSRRLDRTFSPLVFGIVSQLDPPSIAAADRRP